MLPFDTTTLPEPPRAAYRWTLPRQRAFLEYFAISGSVTHAAAHVGVSPRAAYDLRHRRDGVLFALGWQAAILLARHRLADALLERALNGQEDVSIRQLDRDNDRIEVRRQRNDNRLGLTVLGRLDRMAESRAEAAGPTPEAALVRLIAQDFEAFLDQLSPPGGTWDAVADTADHPEDVRDRLHDAIVGVVAMLSSALEATHPLQQLLRHAPIPDTVIHCELARDSAENAGAPDPVDIEARDHARALGVWLDGATGRLQTNFPPPDDFTGCQNGRFMLSDGYARDLTAAESAIVTERADAAEQRFKGAAAEARDRWFSAADQGAPGDASAILRAPLPVFRPAPPAPPVKAAPAPAAERQPRETLDELIDRLAARNQEEAERQAQEDAAAGADPDSHADPDNYANASTTAHHRWL